MVRSAGGVVSEKKFSGIDTTPNREQMMWTALNSLMDEGIDITLEDIKDVPDFYIYELSQHMPIEEIAKKYRGATVEQIQEIIRRHVDRMFELQQYIQLSEKDLKEKLNTHYDEIV